MTDLIAPEEEAQILAALMAEPDMHDHVSGKLRADDFGVPLHAAMYHEIGLMMGRGEPVNPITLGRRMAADPEWEHHGGARRWMQLTGNSYLKFALGFVDHVVDLARRRKIEASLKKALEDIGDLTCEIDEVAQEVEAGLSDSITAELSDHTHTVGQAFTAAREHVEAVQRGDVDPGVIVADFDDWNSLTGGMKGGDLIYIGARPSMGKTALLLRVARATCAAGRGVLLISLEMSADKLMQRMLADLLCQAGGTASFQDIQDGKVSPADMRLLREIEHEVQSWPLVIVDPHKFSAGQMAPLVRRHRRIFEADGVEMGMVGVDYLGLIAPPPGRPNREQEVAAISLSMKEAAKANRVPVIVLSQLSRASETREDKRPMLNDLRESGSLEQDADLVIFVHRKEYYLARSEPERGDKTRESWEQEMAAARDRMDIYTAKHRQGQLQRRKVWFFGANQAIRNSDHYTSGETLWTGGRFG